MKTRIIKTLLAFAAPFFVAWAGGVQWGTPEMAVFAVLACVSGLFAWHLTGIKEGDL
jgi:4-hydroxybenzoate polyprenyltransferase